ncbi:hypothetical protein RvY_02684 [Ramazzottius varieornatus]|uniref:Endonuclease/exonuclease/phosphatase domain-containing protein n=1 Tax=Ramazzottius varieornatus TaxID=947166 RepID=A0A1D1UKK6_RAMVA|nr:hypothetical protein RvY_02684 [Ramazzottius varieornatus]
MPPLKFTGGIGKKLSFLYGNVNGIRSKSEVIKRWMREKKADIVALVETWADQSTPDCMIADLDQYVLFRKDREGCQKEKSGGVAIVVKKDLQALRMTSLEVDGLEVMWIKLICLRLNVLIGVIYAPSYDADVFTKLRSSMEHVPPFLRRNLIIVGDFNCPKIQWEGDSNGKSARDRDLISLKKEIKLWQNVRGDTRIRGKSSSSLEQIFVTQLGFVRNTRVVLPTSSKCDHRAIETKLLLWTPNFEPKPKPVWKIDGDKIIFFKETLSSTDWGSIFDVMCNVDVAVSVFQDKFDAAAKSTFQLRSVGAQRLHRPSLSERAIDSLRRCGIAYKQWRRTKDQVDFLRWKELKASKRRIIQSEKHRRLRNIATQSRRNPRAVWEHIKKKTSNTPIPSNPVPGEDERYIVHPPEKAEFISKEFAQVYIACSQHCLPPAHSCGETIRVQSPKTPHCPPLRIITPLILEQLRRLDSSKASDSFPITNRLLKIAGTSYPLSRLLNLKVNSKQYPTAWKQADVVPVPKKGYSQFRSTADQAL